MTFNSIAKGNLEAVLDCDAPLDLKLKAMNKLMSVYAIVLLRAPSVTKFHPQIVLKIRFKQNHAMHFRPTDNKNKRAL